MSGKQAKVTSRRLRRAFGPDVSDLVAIIDQRSRIAAKILRRGFWGRLTWLILGR